MPIPATRHACYVNAKFFSAIVLLILVFQSAAAPAFADELSFGPFYNRKHVDMTRRLPPVMNVSGKTIEIDMDKASGASATGIELQRAIESLLTSEGSGVKVESNGPDLVIDCQITEYNAPKIETRTENKTTTQTVVGMLQVVFSIKEVRTRRTIASGKTERQIRTDLGTSANKEGIAGYKITNPFQKKQAGDKTMNSTLDAQNEMVDSVAKNISSYLVVTPEPVDALLAVGKSVEAANKLAEKKLWSRDLETLETVTPLTDERLEAYRLYNIGVANEALAYQSQDNKAAIKYLQEASLDYGKAISARPDEKYFLDPQNRIKVALEHYMPPPPRVEKPVEIKAKEEPPVSNEDVIAMVQAKMDDAMIIDNIKEAAKIDFDLSINGQLKMTKSGVKTTIIRAMQSRARGNVAGVPDQSASAPAQAPAAPSRTRTARSKALTNSPTQPQQ